MSTTRAVTALAALIHDSKQRRATAYRIALDVDAAGMLLSPEAAAEVDRLREDNARLFARVAELEALPNLDDVVAWLHKKAREYRGVPSRVESAADALARMADKVSRGAIRPERKTTTASTAGASDESLYCGADLGRDEHPFTCERRIAHNGPCSPKPDGKPASLGTQCAGCGHPNNWHVGSPVCSFPTGTACCGCRAFITPDGTAGGAL